MRRPRASSIGKAIVIYVIVAFAAFSMKTFLEFRSARLSAQEFKHAQQRALQVQEAIRVFKLREGGLPQNLTDLKLPDTVLKNFAYFSDSNGYSLAYYGTNYSTAKKGWTGEYE